MEKKKKNDTHVARARDNEIISIKSAAYEEGGIALKVGARARTRMIALYNFLSLSSSSYTTHS